jgi:DNA-binding NarL/FixJ family response regulator
MVTDKLKELEAARARIANLERSIASELRAELAGLPAKYGFGSTKEFVAAVRAAGGGRRGRPAGSGRKAAAGGQTRRRRAVITDETRASVKKLVEGGKTGSEIAKSLKISLPSVQNIKKSLGLVKKR